MATRIIQGRISESVLGADGIIIAKIFDEDPALYNSNAIGDPVDRTGYPGQTVDSIGSTIARLLDIATLRDVDDGMGMYVAARGALDSWSAYALYRRETPASQYEQLYSFDQAAVIGFARTVLASGPTTTYDYTNTVDVELIGGALESQSEAEAITGAVGYLVGNEIILCQAVSQLSATMWRLVGPLVRGWKGTEWAVGTHSIGERFVVLTEDSIRRATVPLADLNEARSYKAASAGQVLEDVLAQSFINTGISLKPWSPVDIVGTVDGSDNIDLTWRRRSRLMGQNGRDFYDPPLGEETESYQIDILSDDETTVKRTLTSTTPGVQYTIANQTTDFGAHKATNLHLNVYQMSAAVGRGYPGHAVLHPDGASGFGVFAMLYEDGNEMEFEDGVVMEYEH